MRTYGVAIVGFGFIGRVHAHAHLSLPLLYTGVPKTDLVVVATSSRGTADAAREMGGFRRASDDWRAVLDSADVDIVHICTPNSTHREIAEAALAAGKHVYCDKPLAHSLPDAESMAAAAAGSSRAAQVTFNYRFVPAAMRARELVEAGFLGNLLQFRIAYLHAGYIDPNRPYTWRLDRERSGGGAIMDLGVHAIDLLRYLTGPGTGCERGGEISAVAASLETVIGTRRDNAGVLRDVTVDDMAAARVRLEGGAAGILEASRLATGVQDELRFELHGDRGALKFSLMDPNWLDAYDARVPEAPLGGIRGATRIECATRYPAPYSLGATKNTVGWLNFHTHSVMDFVRGVAAVEEGVERSRQSPTFADGLAAQRVVDACQRSDAGGGGWTSVAQP